MIKSLLLHVPVLYERVQALRDRRWLRRAEAAGSYAQHGEDQRLAQLLTEAGARGPYVDVGCNHPFKLSNTFLLYRKGWRGLCVDPLPRFAPLYARWRPQDRFMRVAIGETAGTLPFYEFESDVLSTLDADLAAQYQKQSYRLRATSSVQVMRLDTLLDSSGLKAPLSLLSIDIEGHELPALKSMDLARWRPALICLEVATADGRRNEAAIAYLAQQGYETALDLGLNLVLRRAEGRA